MLILFSGVTLQSVTSFFQILMSVISFFLLLQNVNFFFRKCYFFFPKPALRAPHFSPLLLPCPPLGLSPCSPAAPPSPRGHSPASTMALEADTSLKPTPQPPARTCPGLTSPRQVPQSNPQYTLLSVSHLIHYPQYTPKASHLLHLPCPPPAPLPY